MKNEKVILYDSPEAATYITNAKGWLSTNGKFYSRGDSAEHMARYDSCTHIKCKNCGNLTDNKFYLTCKDCRNKTAQANYLRMPFKEYDGSPVIEAFGDRYFFDEEDIIEYMDENELTKLDLLFCDPLHYDKVEPEYWSDRMPEDGDGELPKELQEALDNLNKVIETLPPCSWEPGGVRTTYKLENNES